MPLETKITRGKTQPERLALLDRYVILREWPLLEQRGGVVVDVGFGEHAYTTAEMARRFRQLNPDLDIVGVEADAHRVERARDAYPDINFVTGGFPLSASVDEPVRLVRAMNVLREYHPSNALDAYADWAGPLTVGGLLVAGSSDKFGDTMTALLMRKGDERVVRESLLFFSTLENEFGPWMFRDWLPRDQRRSVGEGDAVFTQCSSSGIRHSKPREPPAIGRPECSSAQNIMKGRSGYTILRARSRVDTQGGSDESASGPRTGN